MRRAPSGWPGLIGILALVGGLLLVHRAPAVTPLGGFLQEFQYADPAGPDTPIPTGDGADNAEAADAAFEGLGETAYSESYWATVVATFDDEGAAASAAATVDVPDGALLLQQGPLLIVTPLEHDPDGPPDPLIAQLEGLGGRVLVEGDRFGEGSIVVDLVCTAASDEDAALIAEEVGDYGAALYYSYTRPPWTDPPLTDDEALARSTYRRWTSAVRDALLADGTLVEYGHRLLAATTAEARERLMAELSDRIGERQLRGIDGEVHPGVAALLAAAPSGTDTEAYTAWGLELGRFMGPLVPERPDEAPSWFEQRSTASIGSVRAARTEVNIGWATFTRFAIGLPALLGYLGERGCADVRVGLTDFDDVRGD